MADPLIERMRAAFQRELDRVAVASIGNVAAAPRFTIDDLSNNLSKFLELAKGPRLESIAVRTEYAGELITLFALYPRALDGVRYVESKTLTFRWLMTWTDAFWFHTVEGAIYRMPRGHALKWPPDLRPLSESEFKPPPKPFATCVSQWPIEAIPFSPVRSGRYFGIDYGYGPRSVAVSQETYRALVAGRCKRRSKGWRKHVSRQKAAERRARWVA